MIMILPVGTVPAPTDLELDHGPLTAVGGFTTFNPYRPDGRPEARVIPRVWLFVYDTHSRQAVRLPFDDRQEAETFKIKWRGAGYLVDDITAMVTDEPYPV